MRGGGAGQHGCLRTGFAQLLPERAKQPVVVRLFATTCALDGRDERLLQWVTDSQVVALLADNYGVESTPAKPCMDDYSATLPLHAHCLFRLGVYLGEMWYLTELAGGLAAGERAEPVSADDAAVAVAWGGGGGGVAGDAGGDGLN